MKIIKKISKNRVKVFLLTTIILSLAVIFSIFFISRNSINNSQTNKVKMEDDSSISIGKIHHTATRNGNLEWSLEADSVKYITSEQRAIFKDIMVTFFLKNNEKAYLKARRGILMTDKYDIEADGDIVMENNGYRISTKSLNYKHQERSIYAKLPVVVQGDSFSLSADDLKIELDANKTYLTGNVKGSFDEKIKL